MRAITVTAMIIAFLTVPALAQQGQPQTTRRSDTEKKEDAELDKAYKSTIDRSNTPAAAKADPWRIVRPSTPDKPKQ